MGGTVSQIANTVANPIGAVGGAVGTAITGNRDVGRYTNFMMNPGGAAAGAGGAQAIGAMSPISQPPPPETPQTLNELKKNQLEYANQFQAQLPQMQKQMAEQLSTNANKSMNAQLKQVNQRNSARGLAYGGVNEGQQQNVRSQSQGALAESIKNSNAGLLNASNTLNAQALETGVGIQQTQQAIQNQIYQQQLANMNANNAITGSMMGTGLLLAMA